MKLAKIVWINRGHWPARSTDVPRTRFGSMHRATPDSRFTNHTTQLIAAAQRGDVEALGELLGHYRQYLVFLARAGLHHHMQGKADPSDLAQEVCLAAHGNIGDFRGDSAEEFAGWLRGILSNVLAMHVRKYLGTQKRDPRLEQNLNVSLANASGFLQSEIAADMTSPSQNFARKEAFLELAAAIRRCCYTNGQDRQQRRETMGAGVG